jgi:hypothetical protein
MADHGGQRTRDLTLNETPCERQRSIQRFIEEVVTPTASAFEPTDQYPVVFVNRMAELGLCGMLIPEECGGLGLDSVSYAVGRRALAGLDESGGDNQLPPHAYPDDLEIWHVFPTTTLSTLCPGGPRANVAATQISCPLEKAPTQFSA